MSFDDVFSEFDEESSESEPEKVEEPEPEESESEEVEESELEEVKEPKTEEVEVTEVKKEKDEVDEFFEKNDTPALSNKDFDLSPEEPSLQQTYMYYGLKGSGKTVQAMSHPGKIACISFDKKSSKVKEIVYDGDDRITVYDGLRYLNKATTKSWLNTAVDTVQYIFNLLDGPIRKSDPDWVIIDGFEVFARTCEMSMRAVENVPIFSGVNWPLWRERNMFTDNAHNLALDIASHGVVYTAYIQETTEVIENGAIVEKAYEPKWGANVKLQVDVVVKTMSKQQEDQREFWVVVESSKSPDVKTGARVNVTDAGVQKLWEESKE